MVASIAQAESEWKSGDIKWGIKRSYERGKVKMNTTRFLGYTKDAFGNIKVDEKEAEVVKLIYKL